MATPRPHDEIAAQTPESRVFQWFDRRLGLNTLWHEALDERARRT